MLMVGVANTLFAFLMLAQIITPDGFVRWFIGPASRIFYATAPKSRRAMFDNARRLLGNDSTHAEREKLVRAMMTHWCTFIVDLFHLQRVSRKQILDQGVRLEGLDAYKATRETSRGAILVTAHLGNWEYGAVLLEYLNETLNVVFQPDTNLVMRRIFSFQRRIKHVNEVRVEGDPFIWVTLRAALKRDELVLIQGDRTLGDAGSVQPFLDGHARFPEGPVKLAFASGAPLVPVFVLREESGLCIRYFEPMFPDAPGVTEQSMTTHMVKAIEQVVTRHPDQWLMPQRFWIEDQSPCERPEP